jgi:hypothetical protein
MPSNDESVIIPVIDVLDQTSCDCDCDCCPDCPPDCC